MSMTVYLKAVPVERITSVLADPVTVHALIETSDASTLELEKAWHGLHFLFTGTAWEGAAPLDFLVQGGQDVGDEDVGYGPARVFTPATVHAIATALATLTPATLAQRYDAARMTELEIYPSGWDRSDGEDSCAWLVSHVPELATFLASTAAQQRWLLVYCS